MGLNLKGSPVRCHLLETGAEGDTFVFFFFLELKLSVISTQLNLREEAH